MSVCSISEAVIMASFAFFVLAVVILISYLIYVISGTINGKW